MTPQEKKLVAELFDRLATLENRKRDSDAERVIAEGLERAPNAVYALVQTALLQDEALRNAAARIRELEGGRSDGGFLDNMRDALFGSEKPRGSVPPIRPEGAPMGVPPGFRTGSAQTNPSAADRQEQPPGVAQQGGSFLGTAAAAAAGVIGGALLLDSIRSMMGGGRHGATSEPAKVGNFGDNAGKSPWDSKDSGGDLSREAGLDDVGRGGRDHADAKDQLAYDTAQVDLEDDDVGLDFDIGGDSDFA